MKRTTREKDNTRKGEHTKRNNEEKTRGNKTMRNQIPPTSIKLRGKVNVKGHYCKEYIKIFQGNYKEIRNT